jgi:hypothetical protein
MEQKHEEALAPRHQVGRDTADADRGNAAPNAPLVSASAAAWGRFLRLWGIAVALTVAVLYLEADSLAKSLRDFHWSEVKSDTVAGWLAPAASAAASSPKHNAAGHGLPHVLAAAVQIAAVVAISGMWFEAFRVRGLESANATGVGPGGPGRFIGWLRRWKAVAMALIVVTAFSFAMHQAYQPAVLVMALIAIIVAAEHYSGLEEQQHELSRQHTELTTVTTKLDTQQQELSAVTGKLEGVSRGLSDAAANLQEVRTYTGRLAEDAGLSHFVHDVYERYAMAREIFAVVRMHDVDPLWWQCAAEHPVDPWAHYFEDAKDQSSIRTDERRNLAWALARSTERSLSACFVTDLPMPGSDDWRSRLCSDTEPLFGDLLGFAWQWIVLQLASREGVECRALVSRPLCWVHATDRIVFQVLRREPRSRSAVLVVANLDSPGLTSGAGVAYRNMIAWARSEVRRYAESGCSAEDYLLAVLRHAAMLASKDVGTELVSDGTAGDLQALLDQLGAERWLATRKRSPFARSELADMKTAVDLFAKVLTLIFPVERHPTVTVGNLWSKLA